VRGCEQVHSEIEDSNLATSCSLKMLAGSPTSWSQSPDASYNAVVAITTSLWWQTHESITRSFERGISLPCWSRR
jgi:hypothetical protein